MKKGDEPAFPVTIENLEVEGTGIPTRLLLAGMAMQGMLASGLGKLAPSSRPETGAPMFRDTLKARAFSWADALIEQEESDEG